MMLFEIDHTTEYRYSRPVFLEPFILRLRPRSDTNQSLLDYEMAVAPDPAGVSECVDLEGSTTTLLWFDGVHDTLNIRTRSRVETRKSNPFDYIVTDNRALSLPLVYSTSLAAPLAPYLDRGGGSPEVSDFASEIAAMRQNETLIFLSRLNFLIASEFEQEIRHSGPPHPPAETLRARKGSCRDLAVLFIDACRSVGLAARFVSGYQAGVDLDGERHLHAWAEVYLPGAGWRGYDPANGIAVADQHVAVAAAVSPDLAAPTTGSFRGTGVASEMSANVSIRTRSETVEKQRRPPP